MADGRWVMTENELNNVVTGFSDIEDKHRENEDEHRAVDNRNDEAEQVCAFCGSEKLRAGFGKYGEGFGCKSSKCEDCGGITYFVYKDEVGKFF